MSSCTSLQMAGGKQPRRPIFGRFRRFSGGASCALALAVAVAGTASCAEALPLGATTSCPGEFDTKVTARGLDPYGDVVLVDGRTLRLAALADVATTPDPDRRAALEGLIAGRTLSLAFAETAPDRHGRLVALARFEDGTPVQAAILARGLALARPEPGYLGCLESLAAAEAPARAMRLGIWADLPVKARDTAELLARAGHFCVVSGRVETVGNRKRVAYLNFGRNWRQDMTVIVDGPVRDALAEAGRPVADLTGRDVMVRGVIHEADGPAIDVRWMGQLDAMSPDAMSEATRP